MFLLITSVSILVVLLIAYCSYFIFLRNIQNKDITWQKKVDFSKKVTLIIATYNEADTLPTKIHNTLELDYPKENLEILFIDSGSTDGTPDIIDNFIQTFPERNIIFIRENERLGKSHALNIAYPRASGSIKIISDADAILDKSAILEIVSNFSDPKIGAACGRQILLNPDQSPSTLLEKEYRGLYEIIRKGESILDSTPIFHGELSAYRSTLIEKLPDKKSADDSRLANIIRRKGYRSVYDSSAIFYEYAPPTYQSRLTQKIRRGQGLIRVLWDFKNILFKRQYGQYGCLIMPMEFLMHVVFPTVWLISTTILAISLATYYPIVLVGVFSAFLIMVYSSSIQSNNRLLKLFKQISSIGLTYISSQLILVYALILWVSGKSLHKWKKVDTIREEWKEKGNLTREIG